MRFITHINNVKCLEWGINANQGAVFDLFNQMASWATATILDGVTYYWISREKVVEELPLYCQKTDTVYRYFKDFAEKGLILYQKIGNQDLISITEKGAEWNSVSSDFNPTFGNQSEPTRKSIRKSSDLNPTDKYINNKNNQDQSPLTPTGEPAPAETVLDYLNTAVANLAAELGEHKPLGFKLAPWAKNISARIAESSVAECCQVVDYLVAKWGRDGKMREYLCPKTIFRASNFADYLPKSAAWVRNGKPVCVNGKWVAQAEAAKRVLMPSVEEVKAWYLKSLGIGNPFKALDFSDKRNLVLYHATMVTKNKKPLERELLMVISQAIKDTVERAETLRVPSFE